VPRTEEDAGPPPPLIEVRDTVGELWANALVLLGDFAVRVDVDCDLDPLPFDNNPEVVDPDPRTGKHPEGSEVVIVTRPPFLGNPCR
jgi:hypothetical protein